MLYDIIALKASALYKLFRGGTVMFKLFDFTKEEFDIIILAGKGHEPYQEINGTKYPFDERIIVKDIIDELDKK